MNRCPPSWGFSIKSRVFLAFVFLGKDKTGTDTLATFKVENTEKIA